jgi:hypothetical protein
MMMFFWVLVLCKLTGRCQCFGETYCHHLHGWRWRQYVSLKLWHLLTSPHDTKTQKNIIILTAVKTLNLTMSITVYYILHSEQHEQNDRLLDFKESNIVFSKVKNCDANASVNNQLNDWRDFLTCTWLNVFGCPIKVYSIWFTVQWAIFHDTDLQKSGLS